MVNYRVIERLLVLGLLGSATLSFAQHEVRLPITDLGGTAYAVDADGVITTKTAGPTASVTSAVAVLTVGAAGANTVDTGVLCFVDVTAGAAIYWVCRGVGTLAVTFDSIGRAIRSATDGNVVATVQEGDEDIDVRVRYQPQFRRNLDDIASLRVATPSGDLVPFGNIAALRTTEGLGQIDRTGRERVIITLRYYRDLSQTEIARRLGISQMHVSRLQHRALGRLKEILGDDS